MILNPLQQARQQLAARQNGAAADPGQRFPSLLQLAGSQLPFMVGSVDALTFEQGRLQLELLADSRSPAAAGRVASGVGPGRFYRHAGRPWLEHCARRRPREKPGAGDE